MAFHYFRNSIRAIVTLCFVSRVQKVNSITMKKILFIFISILFLFSCNRTSCENAQAATIEDYTGLDGCGLVIKLQNGTVLEPVNLNDFGITPTDGMKVWLKYHEVSGMASICMVGPIVEIDCLTKR